MKRRSSKRADAARCQPIQWRLAHGGVPVDVPYELMGSDRIFETSEIRGVFRFWMVCDFVPTWENEEKKSGFFDFF